MGLGGVGNRRSSPFGAAPILVPPIFARNRAFRDISLPGYIVAGHHFLGGSEAMPFSDLHQLFSPTWVMLAAVFMVVGVLLVAGFSVGYRLWKTQRTDKEVLEPGTDIDTLDQERAYRQKVSRCRHLERIRYRLPDSGQSSIVPFRTRRITRRHLKRARPVLRDLLQQADPPTRPAKRVPRPGFYCARKRIGG